MFSLVQNCLFLILISVITIFGYVPINRLTKKGYHIKDAWDDRIRLIPVFIYPYLFLYFVWMCWFYISLLSEPLHVVQQVAFATIFSCAIGYTFFLFLPTYVITEHPKGRGISIWLLQHLDKIDKQFNACPSMHVYMAVIITLFSSIRYPHFSLFFVIAGTLVIVSTVFTKRHYVYDVFGGLMVGIVCTLLALYII